MIDAITRQRIVVYAEGGAPYFMVADKQLDEVVRTLQAQNISHWIDDDTISLDGEPAVAVVNLGRGADVALVQRMLDDI